MFLIKRQTKIKFSPLGNKNSTTCLKRSITDFFNHFQVVPMNRVWGRTWKVLSTVKKKKTTQKQLNNNNKHCSLFLFGIHPSDKTADTAAPILITLIWTALSSVIRGWQNDRVRYTDVFASSSPGIVATWYPEWSTEQQMMQQQGLRCWDLTGYKKRGEDSESNHYLCILEIGYSIHYVCFSKISFGCFLTGQIQSLFLSHPPELD